MKKITYKKIIKPTIFFGTPLVVAGTTLGISLNSKENKDIGLLEGPKNNAERYYDLLTKNTPKPLKRTIIYPPNNGGKNLNLLENLIQFTENTTIGNKNVLNMIKSDASGKKIVAKEYEINLTYGSSNISSYSDASKEILSLNNKIYKFVDDNKSNKYGIEIVPLLEKRKAKVFLYELKNDDQKFINDYFGKITSIINDSNKNPKIGLKPYFDFIDSNVPKRKFWRKILYNDYGLENFKPWHDLPDFWNNNASKYPKIVQQNGELDFRYFGEKTNEPVSKTNKLNMSDFPDQKSSNFINIKYNHKAIDQDVYLIKNNFFAMEKAISDYDSEAVKIIFYFYKMNNDSIADLSTNEDKVNDPENIYKKTISIPLKGIFNLPITKTDPDGNINLNAEIDKEGQSVLIEDKQSQKQTPNKEILYKRLTDNWIKYLDLPIVIPGLSLMGTLIPSVYSKTHNFIETMHVLKKMKPSKVKEILNEDTLDKIIDEINNAKGYLQPSLIWKELFKNFTGSSNSKWAKLDTFLSSGIYTKQDGNPSSGRILYHFIAGINAIDKPIRARIKKIYGDGSNKDPYEQFSDNKILEDLIAILKANNILDKKVEITDIIGDPFKYIGMIVDSLLSNDTKKTFSFGPKYFKLILSILEKDISKPESKNIINKLGKLFNDSKNVKELALLLKTKTFTNGKALVEQIKNDPISVVGIIGQNAKNHKSLLSNLGKQLFDNNLLSDVIKVFTNSSQDFSSLIKQVKYGFGNTKNLINQLEKIIKDKDLIKNLLIFKNMNNITLAQVVNLAFPILTSKFNLPNITQQDKILITKLLKTGLNSFTLQETKNLITTIKSIISSPSITKKNVDIINTIVKILNVQGNDENIANFIYYITR